VTLLKERETEREREREREIDTEGSITTLECAA